MSLELYLINKESKYQLYHNSSKQEESKLEELVEEKPKIPTKFNKVIEYINSTRLKRFLDNYVKKAMNRLQNHSLRSFKAASLIADVNINYNPNLTEKEAKKTYKSIVRKEIFKNSLSLLLNIIAVPVCYIPPLALIPGSSIPFVLIGYQSFKSLTSILKGKNNVKFIANQELAVLEDIVDKVKEKEALNNQDLLKYYETHYEE